ncbi:HAD-like domain-containing protein [Aspergillus aurantiobrunneus]
MSPCGAHDKLFSRTVAVYRSSLKYFSRLLPIAKVPVARASIDGQPMFAPAMKSQSPSNTESQMANKRPQDGMAVTFRSGWRPYRGRWNAKVTHRGNHNGPPQREAASHNIHTSQRGRSRPNQRTRAGDSNGVTDSRDGQSGQSFSPRKDLPSVQPPQSQNGPIPLPVNNSLAGFTMMNPSAMFGGFPVPINPSTYQMPYFMSNMTEQQQPQSSSPLNPSLPNPAILPLLSSGNPFMAMSPFPSPAGIPAAASSVPVRKCSGVANADNQALKAPQPPSATKKYLDQSSLSPQLLASPRPLLVILDLNGTLIYRKTKKFPPSFARRAGLDEFLDVLVKKYKVMIWSSSTPQTVDAVCQKLFTEPKRKKLVAEWGRDKLGLTKSAYNSKIQVYKTLDTVWSSKEIQASYSSKTKNGPKAKKQVSRWDQTNTVLIDDSKLKALSEPYNLIDIPEFTNDPTIDESTIFPRVLQRLEILSTCDDVSKMIYQWTSTNPETRILDLDLGATKTSPGDKSQAGLDPAEARKLNRKNRKLERRAARKAAAVLATRTSVPGSVFSPQNPPPNKKTDQSGKQNQSVGAVSYPGQQTRRSPSAASPTQSENPLLDRLEESLNS